MRNWNPRYVQYARFNGKTPDEMLEHDRNGYGATMTRFILFISEVKSAFFKEQPDQNCGGGVKSQAEFDKFIAGYVDAQLEKQHAETQATHPRGWDKV